MDRPRHRSSSAAILKELKGWLRKGRTHPTIKAKLAETLWAEDFSFDLRHTR